MTLELLVPIMIAAGTVLGSVWVATYNSRKASERVAQEANRAKKAEAYRTFMNVLLKTMKAVKSGQDPNPILAETFLTFTSDVVVYGNPEVGSGWRRQAERATPVFRSRHRNRP